MKSEKLVTLFKEAVLADAIDVNDAEMKKMLSIIAQNYNTTQDKVTNVLSELIEAVKEDIETIPEEVDEVLTEIFDELDENDRMFLLNSLAEIIADSDEKSEYDSEILLEMTEILDIDLLNNMKIIQQPMKFTTNFSNFQKLVMLVADNANFKSENKTWTHIYFSLKKDKLTAIASNGYTSISTNITVEGQQDGDILILAETLNIFVQSTCINLEDNLTFECNDRFVCRIFIDNAEYLFKGYNPNFNNDLLDYWKNKLKLFEEPNENFDTLEFHLTKEKFLKVTNHTRIVASDAKKQEREDIHGVLIKLRGDFLDFVATDSYRLVRSRIWTNSNGAYQNEKFSNDIDIRVATKVFDYWTHIYENIESDTIFTILLNKESEDLEQDSYIQIKFGDIIIIGTLKDGNFVDYEKIIPESSNCRAVFNGEKLFSFIVKSYPFTIPEPDESEEKNKCKLDFFDGELTLSFSNLNNTVKVSETIPAELIGAVSFSTTVNLNYLESLLYNFEFDDECETENLITMFFTIPEEMIVLKPTVEEQKESLLMLLMPIETNNELFF